MMQSTTRSAAWRDAMDAAQPYADTVTDTMKSTFGRARDRLADVASRASDTRDVAMRATENYVASSPYMTIAIAAAVGLAIGALVMSARNRRTDVYYP